MSYLEELKIGRSLNLSTPLGFLMRPVSQAAPLIQGRFMDKAGALSASIPKMKTIPETWPMTGSRVFDFLDIGRKPQVSFLCGCQGG
jgi:hypothetical protein